MDAIIGHKADVNPDARVALITGGSSALGASIAGRLCRDKVVSFIGFHRNRKGAEAIASGIVKVGGVCEALHLDVDDATEAEAVCQKIHDLYGRLDILVNAAALNIEAPALGLADEDWNRVITTNVSSAFRMCRLAAKFMILGRWGRIINISSISAAHGGRGQVNYAASKAALESMTRVLALETGRKGILCNCVAPGVIESGMSERIRNEYPKELLESIALRRFGQPDDVAEMVAFLASDAAGYISGQVIRVDGGMCL